MNINEGFENGDEIFSAETNNSTDNLPNITAIEDSINSEAPPNETQVELNVDQFLEEINDFGISQKIYLLILCFMMFPSSYQYFIMVFIGNNPPWTCLSNITDGILCNRSSTYQVEDSFYGKRCELPQKAWNFTKASTYSIVTEVGPVI